MSAPACNSELLDMALPPRALPLKCLLHQSALKCPLHQSTLQSAPPQFLSFPNRLFFWGGGGHMSVAELAKATEASPWLPELPYPRWLPELSSPLLLSDLPWRLSSVSLSCTSRKAIFQNIIFCVPSVVGNEFYRCTLSLFVMLSI